MELPGRCGDWLDTATVHRPGAQLMDDTSRGWGLLLGHQRGPHMATSGDFVTAVDICHQLIAIALTISPSERLKQHRSGPAPTAEQSRSQFADPLIQHSGSTGGTNASIGQS